MDFSLKETGDRPAVRPVYCTVNLDIPSLIEQELPMLSGFFHDPDQMHKDVRAWMDFYISNQQRLPIYELTEQCADRSMSVMSDYYRMMQEALSLAFDLPEDELKTWFSCQVVKNRPGPFTSFLNLAKATWTKTRKGANPQTLYGRFDAAMDPASGQVTGIYEFNGDTPVMLFESVNLQNHICTQLGRDQDQANDWYWEMVSQLKAYEGKTIAVAFDPQFIEDAATSETVADMFTTLGANAYMTTIEGLNHSVFSLEKPFQIDGVVARPDGVFILLPWEEMIESGHSILLHWRSWCENVHFFEPPWRWFLSHKGMLAYITHLFETDTDFARSWGHLPHLRTYLSPEKFSAEGLAYVGKPVLGRLSQNIKIHQPGKDVVSTPGMYGDELMVYQEYLPPGRVEGRANFIACGWLAGNEVKTLAFREFDHAVLDLDNERFVAHLLA